MPNIVPNKISVYRLEKGDPGLAFGQILRYLDAIVPGMTLLELLSETDPALDFSPFACQQPGVDLEPNFPIPDSLKYQWIDIFVCGKYKKC